MAQTNPHRRRHGSLLLRQYGVAAPCLPTPEPVSRSCAEQMAAAVPDGRAVTRYGQFATGIKGCGWRWSRWSDLPPDPGSGTGLDALTAPDAAAPDAAAPDAAGAAAHAAVP